MGGPNPVAAGYSGGSPPGTSPTAAGVQSPQLGLLPRQPLPKQLTAAIKACVTLERLAQLCQAHQAVLNPIHVAAIITKLPKLDVSQQQTPAAMLPGSEAGWMLQAQASAQQLQLRQLLQQLLSRLKVQGCSDHSPRGVANIVWALAKLQCAPDAELRVMLLDRFCNQLSSAVPQDISNVLWGVAKLTKEHAAVLSTGDAASPFDSAQGAEAALLQQEQVRLMLQHLCQQLPSASVQTISNSLWAVVVLQQEHQWCMCNCLTEIQTLLTVVCEQPQQAMPGHIQPIVRCMAQLGTACSSHAGESWLHWQPALLQRLLEYLNDQREQLEMHHISSVLRDVAQIVCLQLQLTKQLPDEQQAAATRSEPTSTTPTAYSSVSSLPSMGQGGGVSHSSSTASSSSMLGASPVVQSSGAGGISSSAEDAEDILARLAASGGPQDASSTVLALTMLRPQLQQLGLQPGVAALCSLLPPAALPHLGPELGQRLLAAASYSEVPSACSPTALGLPGQPPGAGMAADTGALPISSMLAARIFADSAEGLPVVPVPLAVAGSASSSSGSNVASPTDPSPIARFGATSPTAAGLFQDQAQLPGSSAAAALQPTVLGAPASAGFPENVAAVSHTGGDNPMHSNPGHSNPGHSNPGHNPGTPMAGGLAQQQQQPAVSLAAGGNEPEAGDSQEEAAARQLTHNIAYADSVFQLADIFTAHASVMDMIHITACITRLSKVLGTSPSQASQAAAASLLPLLGNKLLSVLPHANARGIANVLWGYGRLRSLPQVQLLPPLVEAFLKQLPNAACRDSAVVLWSLARLSEGHTDPAEVALQPALLRRLGREVLQQLAAAAQDSAGQPASQQQQRQPSTSGSASESGKGEGQEGADALGPPSSRDVSNSLMALARLGFVPEDDTAAPAAPASTGTAGTAEAPGVESAEQPTSLSMQLQGLALTAPGAAAGAGLGSSVQLTLPLSQIKAVVDYLLRMAATAKTLDLQETATALKQLGLRELHAKVAATVITQHGSAHGGPGGHGSQGMQYMQLGGGAGGRMGQMGRHGGHSGHLPGGMSLPGAQFGGMMQQRRQQPQFGGSGSMYGQGWAPMQAGPGQYDGAGMLRQAGPQAGYMPSRQSAAGQVLRNPALQAQQQQQAYMMAMPPAGPMQAAGSRPGMQGFSSLGGGGMAYGEPPGATGSPAAGAGGYSLQYPGEPPQPAGLLQQQGGGYAPAVQYMLLPQQPVGGYVVQQQVQQPQQGEFLGMSVLQPPAAGEPGPPGLPGPSAGGAGQQQYYMQATSAASLVMPPGMGVMQEAAGIGSGQQQLLLQSYQQAQGGAGPAGLGALGQFGGGGVYQTSAGMMVTPEYVPEVMTSSGYTAAVAGDIFLAAPQQQQPQQQPGQRSQLQLLQRQVGQPVGLYQQQQGQQQQGQQLPVMYGMPAQGQQQGQQQFAPSQPGAGTFVLDPSTGMYHFQQ